MMRDFSHDVSDDNIHSTEVGSKLFESFEVFANRDCLKFSDSPPLTYADVLKIGDSIFSDYSGPRALVFIEGDKGVSTIASYIAAIRRGYVVHILDRDKTQSNTNLISAYRPNIVISCDGRSSETNIKHEDPLSLADDLAVLLSTSGSTGVCKFVKLTHKNLCANTKSIVEYLKLNNKDVAATLLAPFYSYGLSIINTHLNIGASLLVTDKSIQDEGLIGDMASAGVTNFPGVPYSFELLSTLNFDWIKLRSLRFITQAGGKLSTDLVTKFSKLGEDHGWEFFVMYGQTEASPRISYLPPSLASKFPESIGRAIPGGKLTLLDDDGNEIEQNGAEGELVYSGDNVMIGYATSLEDLAISETISKLHTGDLAVRLEGDLFQITGRKSRFLKLFGLRIGLDSVEGIAESFNVTCAALGSDEELVLFTEGEAPESLKQRVAEKIGVPISVIQIYQIDKLPRLSNGKKDYRELNSRLNRSTPWWHPRLISEFLIQWGKEFRAILLGGGSNPKSVLEIFKLAFPTLSLSLTDNFASLEGDSMTFVQVMLSLENYLGELPEDWQTLSLSALEDLKRASHG